MNDVMLVNAEACHEKTVELGLIDYWRSFTEKSARADFRDLIYMKQAGAAFTMDVFKPKASQAGIGGHLHLVSGWMVLCSHREYQCPALAP